MLILNIKAKNYSTLMQIPYTYDRKLNQHNHWKFIIPFLFFISFFKASLNIYVPTSKAMGNAWMLPQQKWKNGQHS